MDDREPTWPWRLTRRVLPQHTDHAGVMWHGAYLRWLEEARVEALAAVGLPYRVLSDRGLELPVVSLTIDYRRPLQHGDCVEIESMVGEAQGLRLPWCSRFVGMEGHVAATARVELVLVESRPHPAGGVPQRRLRRQPPADLAEALAALRRGPRTAMP